MVGKLAQQQIVVGVSGSRASLAALRWAADEARCRDARLTVVRAWDHSLHPAPYAGVGMVRAADDVRVELRIGLAATVHAEFGPVPPPGVAAQLAEGFPERVLIDQSVTADLLVLGTARPHDAAGGSMGPVIRSCLNGARCPVVVVSAVLDGGDPAQHGHEYVLTG